MLEVERTGQPGLYGHRKWPKLQRSRRRRRFRSIRQAAATSMCPPPSNRHRREDISFSGADILLDTVTGSDRPAGRAAGVIKTLSVFSMVYTAYETLNDRN